MSGQPAARRAAIQAQVRLYGPGLRAAGWSYEKIGARFGCSVNVVRRTLDSNVAERSRREAADWKQRTGYNARRRQEWRADRTAD